MLNFTNRCNDEYRCAERSALQPRGGESDRLFKPEFCVDAALMVFCPLGLGSSPPSRLSQALDKKWASLQRGNNFCLLVARLSHFGFVSLYNTYKTLLKSSSTLIYFAIIDFFVVSPSLAIYKYLYREI